MKTYNPIQTLLDLYRLSDEDFSQISGIPISLVIELHNYLPVDIKSPAYLQVTDEQFQNIADYFETPVSGLKEDHPSVDISHFDAVSVKPIKHILEPIAMAAYQAQVAQDSDRAKLHDAVKRLQENLRKDG